MVILRIHGGVVNGGLVSVKIGVVVDRSWAIVAHSNSEAIKAEKGLILTRMMAKLEPNKAVRDALRSGTVPTRQRNESSQRELASRPQ